MRLAIVPHRDRPRSLDLARRLADAAAARDIDVVASAIDAPAIGMEATDLDAESGLDLIVALGGDGTVLKAVRIGLRTGAPVYGINAGHLGFLAEGEPSNIEETVDRIAAREWFTSSRMMIQARINDDEPVVGLNDVVIEKIESQRTVKIAVAVDGEPFVTYSADGVVIATPTGSTAYSLSAGGPLVDPDIDAIIMTPVAAHSLFSRSVLFPEDREITATVLDDRSVGVAVDGMEIGQADPDGIISVTRAEQRLTFVSLSGRSYPTAVKRKFSLE